MDQLDKHVNTSQKVLFPETITLSPSEAVLFNKILPDLSDLGFDLSDLGGNTFALNGVPADIDGIDPIQLLREMVAATNLANVQSSVMNSQLALRMAQCAAIPYGQVLSNEEMENIINALFTCSNVNYTPDGKAILCILPQTDIEQLMG